MNKKKILVVDDNEDICLTIKQYLELYHYFVEAVHSGRSSPNYCVNSPLIDNMDLMT
ncbi:hypothetical protein PthstB1num2_35450 [Parageobacillus thermoglucosidasius]|nr:hypothetical protein PthstB1num2_35450 [Parageobacillus thermoglucosidasius]